MALALRVSVLTTAPSSSWEEKSKSTAMPSESTGADTPATPLPRKPRKPSGPAGIAHRRSPAPSSATASEQTPPVATNRLSVHTEGPSATEPRRHPTQEPLRKDHRRSTDTETTAAPPPVSAGAARDEPQVGSLGGYTTSSVDMPTGPGHW
uniref:Uncharacterized protein n=1 Tax=Knipowitschia caucasica TaxID=637954 RepID=A0AAV2JZ19_KNICA